MAKRRITLPHIDVQTSRYRRKSDGKLIEKDYYYYRRGQGERIKMPGKPPSEEFMDRYRELEAQALAPSRIEGIIPGTFEDLIGLYKQSPEYLELADSTRADYKRYLDIIGSKWGKQRVANVSRKHILAIRNAYSTRDVLKKGKPVYDEDGEKLTEPTPRRANYVVQILSILFGHAIDHEMRENNPALKIRKLKTGPGYAAWTEADVVKFIQSCPPVEMRRAMFMGLFTGQRGSDVIKMTWAQYDGSGIEVVQQKTGARLWIPIHADLKAELALIRKKKDAVMILTSAKGQPYKGKALQKAFRKACDKAGLQHLSFHGLRKLATSRLIDAGCDRDQVKAITGHATDSMIAHYDKAGNQKKRATAAIARLKPIQGGKAGEE